MSYNSCTGCTANCTHCMCCTRSPLQKPIAPRIRAFCRSGKDHSDLVSEWAPLSLHHPPGGTWVHHHPSPLRGERAARACAASRIYIAEPPPFGVRAPSPLGLDPRLCPRSSPCGLSSRPAGVAVRDRDPASPRPFVCALCVACLPPVTLCQQPTASFGRRRLQPKLPVSSIAPGRLPRLAAAGRRRAGRSVRFRKEPPTVGKTAFFPTFQKSSK